MTAKGPVKGPTTPNLTIGFSAAVALPPIVSKHNNTAASRGFHARMIALLADTAASRKTARFSFLLPWKKIAFIDASQERFEPTRAPLNGNIFRPACV
jgi:hypothetical protein